MIIRFHISSVSITITFSTKISSDNLSPRKGFYYTVPVHLTSGLPWRSPKTGPGLSTYFCLKNLSSLLCSEACMKSKRVNLSGNTLSSTFPCLMVEPVLNGPTSSLSGPQQDWAPTARRLNYLISTPLFMCFPFSSALLLSPLSCFLDHLESKLFTSKLILSTAFISMKICLGGHLN